MKIYLITTAVIWALFALIHVVRLALEWRSPLADPGFVFGMLALAAVSGGLGVWALLLLRGVHSGGAGAPPPPGA